MADHVLIASTTVAANTLEVTLDLIPDTYRDLVLIADIAGAGGSGANVRLEINGNQSGVYLNQLLRATSGGTITANHDNAANYITLGGAGVNLDGRRQIIVNILDANQTDRHKPILITSNRVTDDNRTIAARFAATGRVQNLTIFTNTNNIGAGSTLSLYGIIG